MRRSIQVTAPLLAATALSLLTACRRQPPPQMQRCVDENNHVVAENLCQNLPNQPAQRGGYGAGGYVPFIPMYRYYYGGGGGYGLGSSVFGGGYMATPGARYSSPGGSLRGGTTRGGFGSTHSSGGEGHGGGGE